MDAFLGKITQHAMNYAIRSGIAITSTYAISQCSRLLKTVDDSIEHHELQALQRRLESKIRIISPAIDMIELISARGNTSLESAVSLTKSLRWDIQSLGVRVAKAASDEELSRYQRTQATTRATHETELRLIVKDIRELLARIEDAVPLINLAITTSGASLSTTLPATVSPSRLLQASTFLTAGDTHFSMHPQSWVQIGPTFTLSVYMLFTGHADLEHVGERRVRDNTWKEIIHKARVKLIRVPLAAAYGTGNQIPPRASNLPESSRQTGLPKPVVDRPQARPVPADARANEFAYQLEIIEDLDDDRVHSFEVDASKPGPYKEVELAGLRELIPIHQVSKIFYADTGKILNIGGDGGLNSPVLLLKRDVNAIPPRRMMEHSEQQQFIYPESEGEPQLDTDQEDSQLDVDHQLHSESPASLFDTNGNVTSSDDSGWQLPLNLDLEWIAFDVFTESEEESSEDGQSSTDDSAPESEDPHSVPNVPDHSHITTGLAQLELDRATQDSASTTRHRQKSSPPPLPAFSAPHSAHTGAVRSSLSLMEMLIRLTALQQFQQSSHLAIPDELLTFFLEESSTTGAGGDGEERRQKRNEARQKVGFDPYDESPVKLRGEEYQYQNHSRHSDYSRNGTPDDGYGPTGGYRAAGRSWSGDGDFTPEHSPEPWLLRSREHSSGSRSATPDVPSSPYVPPRRATRPLERLQKERHGVKGGSPLGRGMSVETDSTLGTSPGTPTLGA